MAEPEPAPNRPASVLEDPSARQVARTYAEAFLNAVQAASADAEGMLGEFHEFVDDVLTANPEFERLLTSAAIGRDDKIGIVDRVLAGRASDLFTNFLRVLARHERMDVLPLVLAEMQLEHERRTGRARVQVSSAKPLSGDLLNRIRERLASQLSFEPILETRVEPGLLGGLVIQVGDTVYDSSLRTRMRQLGRRLRERSLHEIQSGRDRFSHPEGD